MAGATEQELRAALLKPNTVMLDFIRIYAPEFCNEADVVETRERVKDAGGVLAYLAQVRQENLKLLLKSGEGEGDGGQS